MSRSNNLNSEAQIVAGIPTTQRNSSGKLRRKVLLIIEINY